MSRAERGPTPRSSGHRSLRSRLAPAGGFQAGQPSFQPVRGCRSTRALLGPIMNIIHLQKVASIPMDQGLLNQAVGFFNAASRCFANVAITPRINNSPMTPGVVCAAFSIELYLKLIYLLASGNLQKGHKLDELFAALPAREQQQVTEKYGNPALAAHIAEMSNAFVTWRYEHEHEALTINPSALMALATACHSVVREMKPQLTVFGESASV